MAHTHQHTLWQPLKTPFSSHRHTLCLWGSHKTLPLRNTPLSAPLTCRRGGRAVEGGQRAGWPGSAGFQLVQAGRLLVQEGQWLFGLSELVSGQVLDPAEWPSGLAEEPFGQGGRLLGWAGLQGWAGSVGCVSGSWGSVSLSWAQNGNLWWTEGETRIHPVEMIKLRGERFRINKKKKENFWIT